MKKTFGIIILIIILMVVSFFVGLNFYKNEDVNHDGKVDVVDLLLLKKYILEMND